MVKYLVTYFLLFLLISIGSIGSANAQVYPTELDTTFKSFGGFEADSPVYKTVVQPDGKIIAVGNFKFFGNHAVKNITRINPDGTIDLSFVRGLGANQLIKAVALQADGKILIGGSFTTFNGNSANHIARLNADGSFDNTFLTGTGINTVSVFEIHIQSNAKILVAGAFTDYNGTACNNLIRLNSDGSPDAAFNAVSGVTGTVYAIREDLFSGNLFIAGTFTSYNGTTINSIARINQNGALDNSFNPGSGASGRVNTLAVQPDGKVVGAGSFGSFNGTTSLRIVRLNTNGSVDNTFNTATGPNAEVLSIAIQSDGKFIIGGLFDHYGSGNTREYLTRINTDCSLDNTFKHFSGPLDWYVFHVRVLPGNRILAVGEFELFADPYVFKNFARHGIVIINPDASLDKSFKPERGGYRSLGSTGKMKILTDSKILLTGVSTYDDVVTDLTKTNQDGTIDNTFHPVTCTDIRDFDVQPYNGSIIVGGGFSTINGSNQPYLVRLKSNGIIDPSFVVSMNGYPTRVNAVRVLPDSKIIIGGSFGTVQGQSRPCIARLNPDGSLDNGFIPYSLTGEVWKLDVSADGKMLVYMIVPYASLPYQVVRLNADGSLDTGFQSFSANSDIYSMKQLANGKIMMAGRFRYYANSSTGGAVNGLMQLNNDGTVNTSFISPYPAYSATSFNSVCEAPDGIFIGGESIYIGNVPVKTLSKIDFNGALLDSSFNGVRGWTVDVKLQEDGKILVLNYSSSEGYNNVIARINRRPASYNVIRGKVFTDANQNCTWQNSEKPVEAVIIKAEPGPLYGLSDAQGNYFLKVDTGQVSYTLSQIMSPDHQKQLLNQCASSRIVALTGAGKDTTSFDFADSVKLCDKFLSIDIQSGRRRLCSNSSTYVYYKNFSTTAVGNVQLKVIYPEYVSPKSSTPAWSSINKKEILYNLGTLNAGQSGQIILSDSVFCNAAYGLTQCVRAIITPGSSCDLPDPSWDNSTLSLNGLCINGDAAFGIINTGTGNMTDSSQYRIYKNDTLAYQAKFKLVSTDTLFLHYPAAGNAIRLEVDQRPGHPGFSKPAYVVEGCGGASLTSAKKGYVNSFPLDNEDFNDAISCMQINYSYDPNDKEPSPSGWSAAHYMAANDKIDYTVNFQNTGNDTAYVVKIVDTLDQNIDVASFSPGIGSHPYTWTVSGKGRPVITFTFNNIYLPDSTTNKKKSTGFIKYSVKAVSGISEGTVVQNNAAIYFDYNAAVITNTTFHTIKNTREQNIIANVLPGTGKYDQTVSFPPSFVKTYGDVPFSANAISNSGTSPAYLIADTGVVKLSAANILIKAAGATTITATFKGDTYFKPATVTQNITVNKKQLSVKAADTSATYGAFTSALIKLKYTGFVNSENISVLDSRPNGTTTATTASAVGTYAINLTGGTDNNYDFVNSNGLLTIDKAILQAKTVDTAVSYGVIPVFRIKYTGFVLGENASVLDNRPAVNSSASAGSPVGIYSINLSGGSDNNYSIVDTDGYLTINKAALNLVVEDTTAVYGSPFPAFKIKYTGFVLGENSSVLDYPSYVYTSAPYEAPAGTYYTFISTGIDDNYALTSVPGVFTISKAPLIVQSGDTSSVSGSPLPVFKINYTGFVYGETVSVLDVLPSASTNATSTSSAGDYTVHVSGGSDDNYDFIYSGSILSIMPSVSTASKNQAAYAELSIRPNPVVSELIISGAVDSKITLYNSLGAKITEVDIPENGKVDLSMLSTGIFIYEIKDQKGNFSTGKLIKQ